MSKYLAMLLATHLTTTSIIVSPLINNSTVKTLVTNLTTKRPYYKNIDSTFRDYSADVAQQCAYANNSSTSEVGTIFYWNDYADSWDEFKNNYSALSLTVNMNIAFNWYNIKWTSSSLYIPLDNVSPNGGTNWVTIHEETQTTTQGSRWDSCNARLSYDCFTTSSAWVGIRFQLTTWASNNYDNYYYTIDTRHVTCNTTFNYNTIKSKLEQGVNNQTLNLQSDFSTSVQDSRNWPLINQNIEQLVQSALGSYYDSWKSIIYPDPNLLPYGYDDKTNQVTLKIDFNDPNTNQPICWQLKINVHLSLSGEYWTKTLQERLHITPGKVIDPNNPNGIMIEDTPLSWAGKSVYSTTAFVNFTGNPDDSETMSVNGQEIQVIDHHFYFNMDDHQSHTDEQGQSTNEYDILLQKHDPNDWTKILGKYEINYVINQNTSLLKLKWHAWNPKKNSDQNELISPNNSDGSPNPKYDKEVNAKTGTKTQIMWIKHQAENPFPLDPLNQQGKIITDGNYEQGFIAEGAVSGMGIEQSFNDPWIKNVSRESVDPESLASTSSQTVITSDEQGRYFSPSGVYHYTITDQKGFTANKFITIGQDYENKYAKFLDVLNNPSVAVDFWTTIQGQHLKYYLIDSKHLDSKGIQDLAFEQVTSYWKEYVSDIQNHHIPTPKPPTNIMNLNDISLDSIKMNYKTIDLIRNEIVYEINKILNKYYLVNKVDYEIKPLDDTSLQQLLNFKPVSDIQEAKMTININSLATSSKAIGSTTINFINSPQYDPKTVIDLSKITLQTWEYNFNGFDITKLRQWILIDISNELIARGAGALKYNVDYAVANLDDKVLTDFLDTSNETKTAIFPITAIDESMKVQGSTALTMINNPNARPAPPVPPDPTPKPDPDPKPAIDLSNLKLQTWEYNFNGFDVTKLRQWILIDISNELIVHGAGALKYNVDYAVANLDDETLTNFLDTSNGTKTLTFTITAINGSLKAKDATTLTISNNPNAHPTPPIPPEPPIPIPTPNPIPHPSWFSDGNNLAWFLPLTIGSLGFCLGLGYYIYVRNKKGIGGKKIRRKSND